MISRVKILEGAYQHFVKMDVGGLISVTIWCIIRKSSACHRGAGISSYSHHILIYFCHYIIISSYFEEVIFHEVTLSELGHKKPKATTATFQSHRWSHFRFLQSFSKPSLSLSLTPRLVGGGMFDILRGFFGSHWIIFHWLMICLWVVSSNMTRLVWAFWSPLRPKSLPEKRQDHHQMF